MRGPATTCRQTGRWASASRSQSKLLIQSRPGAHQVAQQLCAHRPSKTARQLKHAPLNFLEHSLCSIRSSMGSGGEEDHPDRSGQTPRTPGPQPSPDHTTRSSRARPPAPPFRNVGSPLAAVQPPPSQPCSVYHSLSIVPVGAVTPPGGHGPPARGLPAPRRRAHRAPPGHRRAPGGLPARSGGGRRRHGPAAVRRARVPGVPDVRRGRARRGAVSVRGLRPRAPGTVLVQRAGVVSQLWWSPDDGARRPPRGRGAAVGAGAAVGPDGAVSASGARWRGITD